MKKNKVKSNDRYRFRFCEYIGYVVLFSVILAALGMVYFHNLAVSIVMVPIAFVLVEDIREDLEVRKKAKLLQQFKDFIQGMNVSLKSAGKSLTSCFDDSYCTMQDLYSQKNEFMKTMKMMYYNLHQNRQCRFDNELVLMAESLKDDDVMAFAMAVKECYGVNTAGISKIIDRYTGLIEEKRRISEEVCTMVRSQRVEQLIMIAAPTAMLFFMNSSMADYVKCLYETAVGRLTMLGVYMLNIISFMLGNKIMRFY